MFIFQRSGDYDGVTVSRRVYSTQANVARYSKFLQKTTGYLILLLCSRHSHILRQSEIFTAGQRLTNLRVWTIQVYSTQSEPAVNSFPALNVNCTEKHIILLFLILLFFLHIKLTTCLFIKVIDCLTNVISVRLNYLSVTFTFVMSRYSC